MILNACANTRRVRALFNHRLDERDMDASIKRGECTIRYTKQFFVCEHIVIANTCFLLVRCLWRELGRIYWQIKLGGRDGIEPIRRSECRTVDSVATTDICSSPRIVTTPADNASRSWPSKSQTQLFIRFLHSAPRICLFIVLYMFCVQNLNGGDASMTWHQTA